MVTALKIVKQLISGCLLGCRKAEEMLQINAYLFAQPPDVWNIVPQNIKDA